MNKRQEYHFADINISEFNTQTLRAISVKLSKDYLGFFGKLEKLYLKRKQGEVVLNTVYEIKQTLYLLDRITTNEKVSKEDAKILVDSINRINEDKNYFLEQVQNNEALKNELNQVSEVTGISPEDLNITEDIVKKGVKQARTSLKRKRPNLKGTMSYTKGLAGSLAGGLGVAALGPLAPIAGMGWGMMKDVFGLGGRIGNFAIERHREKQERQLSKSLRPAAYNASSEMLGGLSARRSVSPFVKEFSGSSGRESNPLVDFFDRKAYKTKWTKEVLKSLKDSEKNSKSFGQKLGDFFTGILGMAATLLSIAATLIAAGLAIASIYQLVKAIFDLQNAGKGEKEAGKNLVSTSVKFLRDVDKKGLSDKQINALGRTGGRAGIIKDIKFGMKTEAEGAMFEKHPVLSGAAAGLKYVPFLAAEKWLSNKLIDKIIDKKIDAALVLQPQSVAPLQKPSASSGNSEILNVLGLVPKQLKNIAEQIGKGQEPLSIKQTGSGNMYDSGDMLLNGLVQGKLTIGE